MNQKNVIRPTQQLLEELASGGGKLVVLEAANSAQANRLLKQVSAIPGVQVAVALDPAEARRILEQTYPDVVLVDLRLEKDSDATDTSGIELIKRLGKLSPATKVLVVSTTTEKTPDSAYLVHFTGHGGEIETTQSTNKEKLELMLARARRAIETGNPAEAGALLQELRATQENLEQYQELQQTFQVLLQSYQSGVNWIESAGKQKKVGEALKEVRERLREFEERKGIRSEIAIPIKRGDEVIGVLHVEYSASHQFSDDELASIVRQVAVALPQSKVAERVTSSDITLAIEGDESQTLTSRNLATSISPFLNAINVSSQ
ncbi:MAG: response regulator [Ardenticatenaceae bacterium]|nr:response regulator [Ardenticatenaceae bacterium]